MGRPRAISALLLAATIVACGGAGDKDDGLDRARRFIDPRSDLVLAVDLGYDGPQWEQVKRLYARAAREGALRELVGEELPVPPTLDGALSFLSFLGVSFKDDVRPLLGGTLLAGLRVHPAQELSARARDVLERFDEGGFGRPVPRSEAQAFDRALEERNRKRTRTQLTLAYRVHDPDALGRLIRKLRDEGLEPKPLRGAKDARLLTEGLALAGDDTLVAAFGDDSEALLRERLRGPGISRALLPSGDGEALVRARARPGLVGALLDAGALRRVRATEEGRAVRGATAALRLQDDRAVLDANVDFEGLAGDRLPVGPAGDVALPDGRGIASAAADQQRTTVYFARLVRAAFPRSRFVRRVAALERRLGIRFEDEVLRQFSGPSLTLIRPQPDGTTSFAARSTLRDPAAMRRLLPRIAPSLPGILEAMDSLGTAGLTGLLLFAPDAPLTTSSFTGDDVRLYEVNGLARRGGLPVEAADTVVYGVIGDQFVVASSQRLAEGIARLKARPAARAGGRLRIDPARLAEEAGRDADWLRTLGRVVTGVEASASAQRGDVVGRVEARFGR